MRLKKYKTVKILLLKIFIAQQKNKLRLTIKLRVVDLTSLFFLWSMGYIVGFTRVDLNYYTVFLKKQFKQFSIKFFGNKLSAKAISFTNYASTIKTRIVFSPKGLKANSLSSHNVGGLLLCDIF